MLILNVSKSYADSVPDLDVEGFVNRLITYYRIEKEIGNNFDHIDYISNSLVIEFMRVAILEGEISHTDIKVIENDVEYLFDKEGTMGVLNKETNKIETRFPEICDIYSNILWRLLKKFEKRS